MHCRNIFLSYTASKKVVGGNGECRAEVTRPKGTVVTLFDMQNFTSSFHVA